MDVNFEYYKIFYYVAKYNNFTRAARVLGNSQPNVTRAMNCLEQHGYQILQYNYRCRIGEIDIVAKEGENLVFCEVKYRTGPGKGSPLEAVDARKQRKIFQAAMYYLTEYHISDVPCRFDVIGIEGTRIQLVKNAFCG